MVKCHNCALWRYDRFTEEYYGMGVGICEADGTQRFCEHECPFAIESEDEDNG